MKNKIIYLMPGPTTSAAEVKKLEELIGASLPADYRAYLLEHNGAKPFLKDVDAGVIVKIDWQGKLPAEGGCAGLLSHMGRLLPEPKNTEDEYYTTDLYYLFDTFKSRIPDDTIAIERAPGGSLFLLGIKGKNRGKVFFWSRDYEDINEGPDGSPSYDNVGFVANSFDEFLDKLEPEPDDLDEWEEQNN